MSDLAFHHRSAVLRFTLAAVVLLIADLALKAWAFAHLAPHETVLLIPGVLGLRLVENHGAVFGIGQGMRWGFVAAAVFALAVVVYFFAASRRDERCYHLALAAIFAGAVGNLYDRLAIGYVRDMLYLFPEVHLPFGWSWPNGGSTELYPWIFNLADSFLVVAIFFIFVRSFFIPSPTTEPAAPPPL